MIFLLHKLIYISPFSVENQLADFKRRYKITHRWKIGDKEFVDAIQTFLMEKRNQLYNSLWSVVVTRHYLLKMKAKYAGMLIMHYQWLLHNYYEGIVIILSFIAIIYYTCIKVLQWKSVIESSMDPNAVDTTKLVIV